MIDLDRLPSAYETARRDLLAERGPSGHWIGELSSSALSTATALSALSLVVRHAGGDDTGTGALRSLITRGVDWLARRQNEDGGWGDTDKSRSNIATTMLIRAAFHLAGAADRHQDLLKPAETYLERQGGVPGLRRRYGKDKTFAVPILTNCALAGLVPWREVSPLPFELACLPQGMFRLLGLPVVSYAIPALVAIGQARHFHRRPLNPVTRLLRGLAAKRSLGVLGRMQPASGGFLEATPLTSFVVMSLAGIGRIDHPVVRRGVEFLVASVRQDGSWPIDTNLATWVTTLSVNALAAAGEDVGQRDCLDWLLSCQQREVHPLTGARPGGWGWTDLSGAVPDADDTPGALLALAVMRGSLCEGSSLHEDRDKERNEQQNEHLDEDQIRRIDEAAETGLRWLLGLQNADGGWPTFCRGWGKLPFDRSGVDLTGHALRALHAWRRVRAPTTDAALVARIDRAIGDGLRFLAQSQRPDGSWVPLWFGNQWHPAEENPVYGTSRVLLAYRDLDRLRESPARRGLQWLAAAQNPDGGWGAMVPAEIRAPQANVSSVEETAVAAEALLSTEIDGPLQRVAEEGTAWLVRAVESGRHRETSPIGFYFARLWYYEKLYPLVFAVSALGQACRRWCPQPEGRTSRRGATETAR